MKSLLRAYYLEKRKRLSEERRKEASKALKQMVLSLNAPLIASFAAFRGEINTGGLNQALEKEGRLVLPKITGQSLQFFLITDRQLQIQKNHFGFMEPIPTHAKEVSLKEACILVPALSFDRRKHRLGYGKGFYDRFFRTNDFLNRMGVGFFEQLHEGDLPCGEEDVSLSSVHLF